MSSQPNKNFNNSNQSSSQLDRIDKHYLKKEIQSVLNLEKGFLITVKNLFLKPGATVREYILIDRNKYVKPIIFLILTSVIFSLIINTLDLNFSFFNIDKMVALKGKIRSKEIGDWTQNNLGYSQLIMGIFIAFWIQLLYRKSNYNLYEILVLLAFVLGESFLILGVSIIVTNLFNSDILGMISIIFYFLYIIWGIGQFFGERKIINYLKAIIAYGLGNATYMFLLIIIAYALKFL